MPKAMRCPNCDAPLEVAADTPLVKCSYCGYQSKQTVALPQTSGAKLQEELRQYLAKAQRRADLDPTQLRRGRGWAVLVALVAVAAVFIVVAITGQRRRRPDPLAKPRLGARGATVGNSRGLSLSELLDDPIQDEQLGAKLESYAACLQDSARAYESRGRYLSWVNQAAGPSCKERCTSWGLYRVSPPSERCQKGLEQAKDVDPRLPVLEPAGDAWLAALKRVAVVTEQANKYYERKDYEDDHCGKGKQLHPELLTSFAELERAERTMRGVMEREYPALVARRLERGRKKDPHGLGVAYLMIVTQAQQLFELLSAAEQGQRRDGDAAAARALIKRLDESLEAAGRAEAQLPKQQRGPHYFLFPFNLQPDAWISRAGGRFIAAAKKHVREKLETPGQASSTTRRMTRAVFRLDTYQELWRAYQVFHRWLKGAGPMPLILPHHTPCR